MVSSKKGKSKTSKTPRPWNGLKGKQLPWLKAYLDDSNPNTFMNKAGSARAAGYKCQDKQSFAEVGCQNSSKLKPLIDAWLDEHGLTRERNKKKLLQLSEANETKIISIKGKIEKDDLPDNCEFLFCSEQEKFTKDGDSFTEYQTTIAITLAANETQRRTTDMMLKVLGQYAATQIDLTADDNLIKLMQEGRKRASGDDDE